MSPASVEAARGFVQAYNDADWDRLKAMLAPDCVYDEVGSGRRAQSAEGLVDLFQGWKRAMPDSEGTVTSVIDGDEAVVLEVTWSGTFTGPWATPQGEVEPTGKQQTSRACVVLTFEGEKIKESRQYFDSMALMQQLGLLEAPAAA